MAKGSYNISVSGDSNLEHEEKNINENQECLNSCLNPSFLRSLSLHDRPRSSRVPTNKELPKSRYRALVSSSLEKIPSNPSLSTGARSKCRTNLTSESSGINADIEVTAQTSTPSAALPDIGQNQPSEPSIWLEGRYSRFYVESEKLLEKTVAILRTVDEDISESFINLTKPESIALESVMETYRSKSRNTAGCSACAEFDLSKESSSEHIYENWQPPLQQRPKDVQLHFTPQTPRDLQAQSTQKSPDSTQAHSTQQSPKNWLVRSPQETFQNFESLLNSNSRNTQPMTKPDSDNVRSAEPIYENWPPSFQQRPKDAPAHSTPQSPKNLQASSTQQSPKNLQASSTQQSPKNLQASSTQQSPKNLQASSTQQSPKNLQASSTQQSPKNLQVSSTQQSPKFVQVQPSQQNQKSAHFSSSQQNPKTLQAQSPQQSLKNLLVASAEKTLKNFESLNSNSENTKPDSDDVPSAEQSPMNLISSPKVSAPDDATKIKYLIEFDLPSDHEQFIKIIGALQSRCLEYREMIQDISFSALEECLIFSERSIARIRHFRRQLESQKRNFRDFKELCCKSVVFGPDSLPISEKVTEVIQSFYLKLLQEENETFMARLEFGLQMVEVYAKMLKMETESKKIITTLEKEIIYLKKTSVGFRV